MMNRQEVPMDRKELAASFVRALIDYRSRRSASPLTLSKFELDSLVEEAFSLADAILVGGKYRSESEAARLTGSVLPWRPMSELDWLDNADTLFYQAKKFPHESGVWLNVPALVPDDKRDGYADAWQRVVLPGRADECNAILLDDAITTAVQSHDIEQERDE